MAMVERDKTKKSNDGYEGKTVDPNDTSLKPGKKSKLDPTQDAWSSSAPPKKDNYRLKLFPAKDGYRVKYEREDDEDSIYYSVNLECRIVSDEKETDNYPVFSTVTTRIGRGKNISTMAGLMAKGGVNLPEEEVSELKIFRLMAKWLKKEPVLWAKVDWKGGYMPGDGKSKYVSLYKSMEDFPELEDGDGYQHVVMVTDKSTGGQAEVRAKVEVKEWYGVNAPSANGESGDDDEEEEEVKPKSKKKADDDDEEEEKPVEKKKKKVAPKEDEEDDDEDVQVISKKTTAKKDDDDDEDED